jgi:hypothetical protein
MKLKFKLALEASENMIPGSSVEGTEAFKDAWELRAMYLEGFEEAKKLMHDRLNDPQIKFIPLNVLLEQVTEQISSQDAWSIGEEEVVVAVQG